MRLFYALSFFALAACDSSSGSKSTPITQTPNIPITDSVAGDNAVGQTPSEGNPSLPVVITGPSTPEGTEGEGSPLGSSSSALKFGLTTTRTELLQRLGKDLSLKAKDFRVAADALKNSTADYCASPSAESLAEARASWRSVMDVWQYFEVFQVGPVSDGAKILKYNIYAWPDPANYCRIDEEALKSTKSASYKLPPNYNRKGLQAVEYFLFDESNASRCAAGSTASNEWNNLAADAKVATRCSYLNALTQEIANQGSTLETQWGTPDNNYITQALTDPARVDQLIQSLYEASYYIDLEVKNQKLAGPAGIDTRYCDKTPEPCLANAEFSLSGYSRQAVDINIAAFTDMFFGSSQSGRAGGLSALVRAEGNGKADAVAERSEKLAAGLAQAAQTEPGASIDQLVTAFAKENCDASANSWICQTRNGIRQIFTDLKGEYASILKVKAPAAAAGDND